MHIQVNLLVLLPLLVYMCCHQWLRSNTVEGYNIIDSAKVLVVQVLKYQAWILTAQKEELAHTDAHFPSHLFIGDSALPIMLVWCLGWTNAASLCQFNVKHRMSWQKGKKKNVGYAKTLSHTHRPWVTTKKAVVGERWKEAFLHHMLMSLF